MMVYSHGRVSCGRDDGTDALHNQWNQWIRLTELDKFRTFKIKLNI